MNDARNCQINLWNEHGWDLDSGMLEAVMERLVSHIPNAKLIDIYPQVRVAADAPAWQKPGWLEWVVNIQYHGGARLTIGTIQRQPGAEYEFHS